MARKELAGKGGRVTRVEESALPEGLAAPARRALAAAGATRPEQLTELREDGVRSLHGVGPKAIDQLRNALSSRGMTFARAD